jgi:ribosomal protein S18 acetylase RimI-like enzyme
MGNISTSNSDIIYRPAIKADARRIAELYSIASDGISDYIWSKLAQSDQNPLDIGQQRFERKNTAFSFENSTVAQIDNEIAAGLLAFEMPADDDYVEEDPVLKPYWLLEEPKSFYIAGITVDERRRKLGIAKTLMRMAEDKCSQLKLEKLSLIVFEDNSIAHDFYLRLGYKEAMRKAIVPHPMIHCAGDALLLVKHL